MWVAPGCAAESGRKVAPGMLSMAARCASVPSTYVKSPVASSFVPSSARHPGSVPPPGSGFITVGSVAVASPTHMDQ